MKTLSLLNNTINPLYHRKMVLSRKIWSKSIISTFLIKNCCEVFTNCHIAKCEKVWYTISEERKVQANEKLIFGLWNKGQQSRTVYGARGDMKTRRCYALHKSWVKNLGVYGSKNLRPWSPKAFICKSSISPFAKECNS